MGNQAAARLSGDDYQHLYTWWLSLELLMPSHKVRRMTVEDAHAGSMDDVTIEYEDNSELADRFIQVKYHVDQRETYSTDVLLRKNATHTSLLEKFWRSWDSLRKRVPSRPIELVLLSNWTWDPYDALRRCLSGRDGGLTDAFFTVELDSDIGRTRQQWQEALGADNIEFDAFARSLRFRLGFDCADDLERLVAERMESLGLKSDVTTLLAVVGIVRDWIKTSRQEVTREVLEHELREKNLRLPPSEAPGVAVYLTTIKEQKCDLPPDYELDWRDAFDGLEHHKGHAAVDPTAWNTRMLPELAGLQSRIEHETHFRLIRARGRARLSAWFAFGYTFSEVAGYTIEVEQGDQQWRTNTLPSRDFALAITSEGATACGESIDGIGETVAVGISVSDTLDDDTRAYLRMRSEPIAALLLLRPTQELGRTCLRDAGDAVALADEVKRAIRAFVKGWGAQRLLLFYCGPLSGACFIGHRLNAVCREIQIMEDQQPGYAPSFLLR